MIMFDSDTDNDKQDADDDCHTDKEDADDDDIMMIILIWGAAAEVSV